jgi:hypothetical protein
MTQPYSEEEIQEAFNNLLKFFQEHGEENADLYLTAMWNFISVTYLANNASFSMFYDDCMVFLAHNKRLFEERDAKS